MRPVLIMSSERSGSNLLRRMLGAHSAVAAPPPPHLWRHLARVAHRLGDLSSDTGAVDRLVAAACRMTEVPGSAHAWNVGLAPAEVRPLVHTPTLSGICGAVYVALAARDDKRVWVCKENELFDHALSIRLVYPDTKVVYLCRDGRDYACSVRKVPSHDQQVFCIAEEWAEEQRRAGLVHQELAAHGQSTRIRYEDLITDPEGQLTALCEFLDLDLEPAMLESHRETSASQDARKTEYWQNLAAPVIADNHGKYRSELTRSQIRLFESVAGDELTALGYARDCADEPTRIGGLRRFGYRVLNAVQKRLRRGRRLAEPGRRERQAMLREIHALRPERSAAPTPQTTPRSEPAPERDAHARTSRA